MPCGLPRRERSGEAAAVGRRCRLRHVRRARDRGAVPGRTGRTDSPADVEDLVQDSLLRAFRAIERFDGRHPRAWLLTIMRNAHISEIRRKKPSLLRDDDIERRPSRSGERRRSAEQEVMDQHFEHHVEVAYRSLTPRFREVIDLVDLGRLSYEVAASVIGVPIGTVMSRLHRGRRRIRQSWPDRRLPVDRTDDGDEPAGAGTTRPGEQGGEGPF